MLQSPYGLKSRDAVFLMLAAALPVLGYQFGLGSQVEQFSIVRRFSDPDFIRADFYVNSAAAFGPRFYYSWIISLLTSVAPLPLVILILTCVTNFALALISFDAARAHLRTDHIGGAIAALIVLVNSGFSLGLAGFIRFESFQPASLAIPLALGGFSLLVARRNLAAAAAFASSAAVHPLIGVECAMISFAACGLADLSRARDAAGAFKLLRPYIPSWLALAAAVGVLWIVPLAMQDSAHISDAEFFAILPAFRAPHHYLASAFPAAHYLGAATFAAGLYWMAWQFRKHRTFDFPPMALSLAAGIVVVLCAASFLLVDIAHNRLWATAQVFRMLFLVKWVGYLFFSWMASRWLGEKSPIGLAATIAPIIATGEAQPLAMAASLAATAAAGRWLPDKSRGQIFAAILLTAVTIAIAARVGVGGEMARAVTGTVCAALVYTFSSGAAIALVAVLIAFGIVNRNREFVDFAIFHPTYGWADLKGPDAEIARWIKGNTPVGSLWATPPDFESFRLIAERAIIVDYTSIPFQELPMREWRARIAALYGEVKGDGFEALAAMAANYRAANQAALEDAARAYGADFAVLYEDTPWTGEILHQNGKYKAVRIMPAAR
ncbi:MAG: hypothetical protein L0Y57_00890 [Beijerinckiaceae bacterium]|nr:hypothetical protein [Beijerinckiaceae bacterium]